MTTNMHSPATMSRREQTIDLVAAALYYAVADPLYDGWVGHRPVQWEEVPVGIRSHYLRLAAAAVVALEEDHAGSWGEG